MHDPWLDRLSEYLDGEMTAGEAEQLKRHLTECDACAATLADLRAVVAAAGTLTDTPPARDLWSGIAARIAAPALPTTDVLPLRAPPVVERRRFSFSAPQLAAAAVLLMALSGTAVYFLGANQASNATSGTIVHTSAGSTGTARTVAGEAPEPTFDADIAALEQALDQRRDQLDPATIDVIERSMESIDRAIADARSALQADPGNPYLHRQLDNTMRKKVDILRHATTVRRGGS